MYFPSDPKVRWRWCPLVEIGSNDETLRETWVCFSLVIYLYVCLLHIRLFLRIILKNLKKIKDLNISTELDILASSGTLAI